MARLHDGNERRGISQPTSPVQRRIMSPDVRRPGEGNAQPCAAENWYPSSRPASQPPGRRNTSLSSIHDENSGCAARRTDLGPPPMCTIQTTLHLRLICKYHFPSRYRDERLNCRMARHMNSLAGRDDASAGAGLGWGTSLVGLEDLRRMKVLANWKWWGRAG